MSDKSERLDPGTLLDHQAPQARWWHEVRNAVLPQLVRKLEQRFGDRHGVSPEEAVSSAIRTLLEPEAKNLRFESIEDLRRWLYTVAWRKVKDALKKEHFERRVNPDDAGSLYEGAVSSGCEEAHQLLTTFRESLDEEERIVLDARLAGKTHAEIAGENGWTRTGVDTLWRRIVRRARRRLEGRGLHE